MANDTPARDPKARDMLQWADESVAPRFSRIMSAATSRYGVLTDPPLLCFVESVLVLTAIVLYQTDAIDAAALPWVWAVLALPLLVGVGVALSLLPARRRVVAWLALQPFRVENVNALLNGVAHNLLVRFEAAPPERDALNALLEQVHEECFALQYADGEPEVEIRIGVADSKLNPASANHRRYLRVRQLIGEPLAALSREHPIELVRIC